MVLFWTSSSRILTLAGVITARRCIALQALISMWGRCSIVINRSLETILQWCKLWLFKKRSTSTESFKSSNRQRSSWLRSRILSASSSWGQCSKRNHSHNHRTRTHPPTEAWIDLAGFCMDLQAMWNLSRYLHRQPTVQILLAIPTAPTLTATWVKAKSCCKISRKGDQSWNLVPSQASKSRLPTRSKSLGKKATVARISTAISRNWIKECIAVVQPILLPTTSKEW